MKISELEPTPFWSIFERITQIPRPSKHEDKILAWLRDFARERGLAYREDEAGNITILKEAQNSASAEPVALQSHVDMVCEKDPGIDIDFENDPIPAYVDGDHVRARGTTLGADCGIGMATALYILDDKNMSHPPIEALFTVDEETGLTGARSLGEDMITAPRLINLDSEDREEVFVGCAGGIDTVASFKAERTVVPDGLTAVTIRVGGLKGGHSGDDIDAGLANANLLLARVMHALLEVTPLWITGIDGGNLRNAIPREAEATVAIIPAAVRQAEAIVSRINSAACKGVPQNGAVAQDRNDTHRRGQRRGFNHRPRLPSDRSPVHRYKRRNIYERRDRRIGRDEHQPRIREDKRRARNHQHLATQLFRQPQRVACRSNESSLRGIRSRCKPERRLSGMGSVARLAVNGQNGRGLPRSLRTHPRDKGYTCRFGVRTVLGKNLN